MKEAHNFIPVPVETEQSVGPEMKSKIIAGTEFKYSEFGNPNAERTIIYIHGWAGSNGYKKGLMEALTGKVAYSSGYNRTLEENPKEAEGIQYALQNIENKYRILALELPGFGISEKPKFKPTFKNYAHAIHSLQNQIEEERKNTEKQNYRPSKTFIFGTSMGGIIGTKLAALYPKEYDGLIMQGSITDWKDMGFREYIWSRIGSNEFVKYIFKKFRISTNRLYAHAMQQSDDFIKADEKTQLDILRAIYASDPDVIQNTLKQISLNLDHDLAHVQCNIGITDGDNGHLMTIEKSRKLAHRLRKMGKTVLFQRITGEAHNVVETKPEMVALFIHGCIERWNKKIETKE